MKKVCVWDADETLWKGTLVEGDNPAVPEHIRRIIQELYERGVVQSIASHNLQDDVLEALNNSGLTPFFLVPQAAFGVSKYEMILTIQDELGLSKLTDFVFVDDQEFNRREVTERSGNSIVCLDPNSNSLSDELLNELFYKDTYTPEDRRRVDMYREEHTRKLAAEGYGEDRIGFLESCEMVVWVRGPYDREMPRVVDLVRRANRLSATSVRYDEKKLHEVQDELWVAIVSDKYGDYGIVGVMHIVDNEDTGGEIKLLVLSCRMQGKGIGSAFLGFVLNYYKGEVVRASWQETPYNTGMRALYEWYEFEQIESNDKQLTVYERRIPEDELSLPPWLMVHDIGE